MNLYQTMAQQRYTSIDEVDLCQFFPPSKICSRLVGWINDAEERQLGVFIRHVLGQLCRDIHGIRLNSLPERILHRRHHSHLTDTSPPGGATADRMNQRHLTEGLLALIVEEGRMAFRLFPQAEAGITEE